MVKAHLSTVVIKTCSCIVTILKELNKCRYGRSWKHLGYEISYFIYHYSLITNNMYSVRSTLLIVVITLYQPSKKLVTSIHRPCGIGKYLIFYMISVHTNNTGHENRYKILDISRVFILACFYF